MNNHNKNIFYSAIVCAIAYLFGFVLLFTALSELTNTDIDFTQKLEFIIGNKEIYQFWMIIIYVLFGISLTVLVYSIRKQFNQNNTTINIATVFGFVWVVMVISSGMIANIGIESVSEIYSDKPQIALATWHSIEIVQDGLGGGIELIGGIWVLLVSLSSIRNGCFNKTINYIGYIVGISGILTIIPFLKDLGAIFGMLQILWFVLVAYYSRNNYKNES